MTAAQKANTHPREASVIAKRLGGFVAADLSSKLATLLQPMRSGPSVLQKAKDFMAMPFHRQCVTCLPYFLSATGGVALWTFEQAAEAAKKVSSGQALPPEHQLPHGLLPLLLLAHPVTKAGEAGWDYTTKVIEEAAGHSLNTERLNYLITALFVTEKGACPPAKEIHETLANDDDVRKDIERLCTHGKFNMASFMRYARPWPNLVREVRHTVRDRRLTPTPTLALLAHERRNTKLMEINAPIHVGSEPAGIEI
jgi:hypothetical protein